LFLLKLSPFLDGLSCWHGQLRRNGLELILNMVIRDGARLRRSSGMEEGVPNPEIV